MKRDDFIAASISTRIYEEDLISEREFERLNDYESLEEVLNALRDTSYQPFIEDLNRPEDYEQILASELKRAYDKIADVTPDESLSQFLVEKYNFHNLKVIIKEIIADADFRDLYSPMGNMDIDFVKRELLRKSDEGFLVEEPKKDVYVGYGEDALKAYEETEDPSMVDIALDKAFYEKKLDVAEKTGLESLEVFQKEEIDLINIKTLLRVKSQKEDLKRLERSLVDGGYIEKSRFMEMFALSLGEILTKTLNDKVYPYLARALSADKSMEENLLDLEKSIDDHYVDFAKDAKSMTYGPEVLLSYLIGKDQEITNLRIIFISKLNKLPKDFTMERLRACIR